MDRRCSPTLSKLVLSYIRWLFDVFYYIYNLELHNIFIFFFILQPFLRSPSPSNFKIRLCDEHFLDWRATIKVNFSRRLSKLVMIFPEGLSKVLAYQLWPFLEPIFVGPFLEPIFPRIEWDDLQCLSPLKATSLLELSRFSLIIRPWYFFFIRPSSLTTFSTLCTLQTEFRAISSVGLEFDVTDPKMIVWYHW